MFVKAIEDCMEISQVLLLHDIEDAPFPKDLPAVLVKKQLFDNVAIPLVDDYYNTAWNLLVEMSVRNIGVKVIALYIFVH